MLDEKIKKNKNIVEYILYMFHTEDLLRSLQLNLNAVSSKILKKYDANTKKKNELKKWYSEKIENLERENLQDQGHLTEVLEKIGELSYIHKKLLNFTQDKEYIKLWKKAYPNILEISKKTNNQTLNPIELCFNGIYGVMILRLQNKKISQETFSAVKSFTDLLNYLRKKYHDFYLGKIKFS